MMKTVFSLLVAITTLVPFTTTSADTTVTSLTPENYQSLTNDKIVFIKYFAPYCGHCKTIAPDWIQLASHYESNVDVLIAEINCTEEEMFCQDHDIQGFPTLKHGDPNNLVDYSGGRSFEDLVSFAKDNLKPSCSPGHTNLCSEAQSFLLETFQKMSLTQLTEHIQKVDKILTDADTELEKKVDELQNTYEIYMTKMENKKKDTKKDNNYGMMKSAMAWRKSHADESTDTTSEEL